MQTVPLAATPNQSLSLVLGDYTVAITVRTLGGQTYVTVLADGVPICAGQVARDRVILTPRAGYLGFQALQLMFADLQGTADPVWSGFGTRYLLLNMAT